jgi:hypothetical protein
MGASCCGNAPESHELSGKLAKPGGESDYHGNPEKQREQAAITMQRYVKGIITRRAIKAKYNFEAKTYMQQMSYTQSDAQILEARRLVM